MEEQRIQENQKTSFKSQNSEELQRIQKNTKNFSESQNSDEVQRVQKFIAHSGYCSRRNAEELIQVGKVKVNGEVITLGTKCLKSDTIEVNGEVLDLQHVEKVYIIMNKPKGYLCSTSDDYGRAIIYDILDTKDNIKGLFSIGRLDKDTTGLLLLTNDGDFSQKIIHPSSKIKKEYKASLNKKLEEKDRRKLEKGVMLDDIKLRPCSIRVLKDKYLIKIFEGRKRQIRRMFEEVGYQVRSLERMKLGELSLMKTGLKYGKYKRVTKEMLEKEIFK